MSDSRSCGRCIYYNSITNECGEESKCMRDVDEAKYTSYIAGKKQGKSEALNIDIDTPMHFTPEQKALVKNYIIKNGRANYERGAREFAEWLATKRGFSKEWVEWHIEHWQKEVKN